MDTVFDFIGPFRDFLILLNRSGIETGDVRYFPAYQDFLDMRAEGHTYYASLETVAERYGMPVGTLRRKFRKFGSRLTK